MKETTTKDKKMTKKITKLLVCMLKCLPYARFHARCGIYMNLTMANDWFKNIYDKR